MPHKCILGYWFSKWVCYHLIGRNVFQNHFILRDHISGEMISNLDMFCRTPEPDLKVNHVTPQKYHRIFIIKFIIYSGYNWANLGIFLGIVR